jgi:tRNA(adenine34) deaminase
MLERFMNCTDFMRAALEEARKAYARGEIPVGAVIAGGGRLLASAGNENRGAHDPTRHAEMIAIRSACAVMGNERLTGCDMYVTKEPCAMCAGAIVHARIKKLIIGARDRRYGACGTVLLVCGNRALNHVPEIEFGLMEEEAAKLLKIFFMERRSAAE